SHPRPRHRARASAGADRHGDQHGLALPRTGWRMAGDALIGTSYWWHMSGTEPVAGMRGAERAALAPSGLLWPAASIVWGPGFSSTNHRHHSVQLVMALTGSLLIRSRPSDNWTRCSSALVRPDVPHEVNAVGTQVMIAFVDPESDVGGALLDRLASPIC